MGVGVGWGLGRGDPRKLERESLYEALQITLDWFAIDIGSGVSHFNISVSVVGVG